MFKGRTRLHWFVILYCVEILLSIPSFTACMEKPASLTDPLPLSTCHCLQVFFIGRGHSKTVLLASVVGDSSVSTDAPHLGRKPVKGLRRLS